MKLETSSILYNLNNHDIKDNRVPDTLIHSRRIKFYEMVHYNILKPPITFQIRKLQLGSSNVLNNLSNHDFKDKGVLDTLIFITEG